jgi:hypothetical protein
MASPTSTSTHRLPGVRNVAPSQQQEHIDLFDDPSWDSKEGREENASYERITVSGLSARTETTVAIIWIGLFFTFIATLALLLLVVTNALQSEISDLTNMLNLTFGG